MRDAVNLIVVMMCVGEVVSDVYNVVDDFLML